MQKRLWVAVALLAFFTTFGQSYGSYTSLSSSLNSSYCTLTGSYMTIGNCIASSIPLALIGIVLSFAIVGIAYMFGEMLNISSIKGWYRGEFWEAAKSTMVIIIIFSTLIIIGGFVNSLFGSPTVYTGAPSTSNAITANFATLYNSDFTYYINPQVEYVNNTFAAAFGLAIGIGVIKSLELSLFLPIPIPFVGSLNFGFSETSLYVSSIIESNTHIVTFSFIKDIIEIIVIPLEFVFLLLQNFFTLIVVLGFGVFIPLGIIFRAFPFLRGIGGTFIGIGMALVLIFPSVLLLFNTPISNYMNSSLYPQPSGVTYNQYSINNDYNFNGASCNIPDHWTLSSVSGAVESFFGNVGDTILCGIVNDWGLLLPTGVAKYFSFKDFLAGASSSAFNSGFNVGPQTLFGESGNNYVSSIYPALNFIDLYIYPEILQFILIIFDIILTITTANAIARLLGGNIRLGIGKFKIA